MLTHPWNEKSKSARLKAIYKKASGRDGWLLNDPASLTLRQGKRHHHHRFFVVRLATAQADLLLFIQGKPALSLAHSPGGAVVRWTEHRIRTDIIHELSEKVS